MHTKDRNGAIVTAGTRVRVISINSTLVSAIPSPEGADLLDMIGHDFVVEEVDSFGQAWISKSWPMPERAFFRKRIGLRSEAMEVVSSTREGQIG